MQSTAKAIALVRDLSDKILDRMKNSATLNTCRQAFDANGWPMLFVSHNGNEAEGQPVVLIRIKGVDMISKDIFGNSEVAFAPHTLEFAWELSATANCPIPLLSDLCPIEFEAVKTGVRFQLKEVANMTAVSEAAINAITSPNADVDDINWPTKLV
jgi:hypothetical protein